MNTQIILICLALGIPYLFEKFSCKKKKCLKMLDETCSFFNKVKNKFTIEEQEQIQETISAIYKSKDLNQAKALRKRLENKQSFFKKTYSTYLKGWVIPIIIVFGIIKPIWFELYQIPTGSMRPTFKEGDVISVSKLQFATNLPILNKHLTFHEDEIKRMGTISFTSENLTGNNKYNYFGFIPGYKQFTKRLIAVGGDTIYYYGGKIYGIDKDGNNISNQLQLEALKDVEHIPFISMQGRFMPNDDTSFVLNQSGKSIAKITFHQFTDNKTEMLDSIQENHDIFDLWGIEGFAKFRIVEKKDLNEDTHSIPSNIPISNLYLELTHHPSIHKSKIETQTYFYPIVDEQKSYIPLNKEQLKSLAKTLYTARFIVKDGLATRYDFESQRQDHPVILKGISDGTYEFFNGQAYKIGFQGLSSKLDENHPLMNLTQENLFHLVNLGIEFDTRLLDHSSPFTSASRYAYYRNGDLYAMGGKIFDKADETLLKFQAFEKRKAQINSDAIAFLDPGAPVDASGNLDVNKIKTYGLTIAKDHYFMLGDNHAMSGDSREFGMVPKQNLRGVVSHIFWGPNERFGTPRQPSYTVLTKPRIVVWSTLSIGLIFYLIHRRKKKHS